MIIKGIQKLTLLDFPGRVGCTIFTAGCNFRCPFCHNASLVLGNEGEVIGEEEIFSFLEARRGRLSGVCISGGEPTLQPDLIPFIRRVREMGYAVKLDTNGYRPEVIEQLIAEGLIDYFAMDIKTSRERYSAVAGVEIDVAKIEKSAALIMSSGIEYEFRTTVVKELHFAEDFTNIGNWLSGAEKYFLQGFIDSGDCISGGLNGYDKNGLEELLKLLNVKIPSAKIRG